MTKNLMALLLILALFSCNKEVEFISLPPFTVYPNPFTDSFLLTLDANIPGESNVRILTGNEEVVVEINNITPGGNFAVDMRDQEKGIYYVELVYEGETFIHPVLKAE